MTAHPDVDLTRFVHDLDFDLISRDLYCYPVALRSNPSWRALHTYYLTALRAGELEYYDPESDVILDGTPSSILSLQRWTGILVNFLFLTVSVVAQPPSLAPRSRTFLCLWIGFC